VKKIKKAIIPVAGLGTRFLPLSKTVPKELFPLVDKPVLQYIVEEAVASGIEEIIFINRKGKETILDYFTGKDKEIKGILREKKRDHILQEFKILTKISKKLSFSQVFQEKQLGDGHAVLQAREKIMGEPVAALWGDDIVESKTPCLLQLIKVFQEYQSPVIALARIPKKRISSYGVVEIEKIKNNIYKIKKIIEKPPAERAPSNLAIVGKYILTPEIFEYLSNAKPGKGGEIYLSENLERMIKNGKDILGLEFEGRWLECGNKENWLKSQLYLSLKHSQFGPPLKEFLKDYI
jgi:UTP--glucose-1-phosphate uridylyltransferase